MEDTVGDPHVKYVRCPRHGENVAKISQNEAEALGIPFGCQGCTAELMTGRDPDTMTGDERAAELQRWLMGPLMTSLDLVHQRADALVGRPIWTHEMATAERLIEEARSQQHPVDLEAHIIGSLDQLAGNKPVIIARVDGTADA
jgi:hypothetical protein